MLLAPGTVLQGKDYKSLMFRIRLRCELRTGVGVRLFLGICLAPERGARI